MTRIYSVDFRERVLAAHGGGTSIREIHDLLGVSCRTLLRWKAVVAGGGSLAVKPKSGRPAYFDRAGLTELAALVADYPDATLAEYCQFWEERHGRRVGASTVNRALKKLGLVRKKRV